MDLPMMFVIRRYYAGFFILSLLFFSLAAFAAMSLNPFWQNALIVLSGALVVSLCCGTFYYLQDTKWGPRKREKRFERSPIKELLQDGFIRQENIAIGMVKGYTAIVQYTWYTGKPAIKLDILFDPRQADRFFTGAELKAIIKRNKPSNWLFDPPYEWTKNSIGYTIEYIFRPPSYEKLVAKANSLTDVLIREGLGKISFEETEALMEKILSK